MQIHELNTFSGTLNNRVYLAVDNGTDTTKIPATEFAQAVDNAKVNLPTDIYDQPTYGTAGQVLRTKGDGETEWANVGQPTDAQTAQAVSDWLDEHPEATTTVEDGSLTYKKLVTGTLGFVTPEMYGAAGDGVTDDTVAIQNALNSGKNLILFPSPKYLFSGVSVPSNRTLFLGNAQVSVPASNDFIFTASSASNIKIVGGVFERPFATETLVGTPSTSGVMLFDNCAGISIISAVFNENLTHNNVRCISCESVEISHCNTDTYHSANYLFLNDCSDIWVHDCTIKNGTNIGYDYIYPVGAGFTDYTNTYKGVDGFVVERCHITYCDWEGIDSHGGRNIRFADNRIINCQRFITAYVDERPALDDEYLYGNIIIENNYCYNDPSVSFAPPTGSIGIGQAFILSGNNAISNRNVCFRNNIVKNPLISTARGVASLYYTDGAVLENNIIHILDTTAYEYLIKLTYAYKITITRNTIDGFNLLNNGATFYLYNASAVITYNSVTPANAPTAFFLVSQSYYSFYYFKLNGNTGSYTRLTRYATTAMYASGDFAISSSTYTGQYVSMSEQGLRRISNDGRVPSATITIQGTSNIGHLSDARESFIPNMFISCSNGNTTVDNIVLDVNGSTVTLKTAMPAGTYTVSYPLHTTSAFVS